jgi:putative spermidine/putrescine transport system ATP-binding protein
MSLELDGLAVPFGDAPGLTDVSLTVGAGERVVLVGASGSGKTSLLRAIAGLGASSGGRIRIGGRDVTAVPTERRGAVYLQQTPALFPHMTVAENVGFPLRIRGVEAAERERREAKALALVRLDEVGSRRPGTLSGGQRHRAALARAVIARPDVLLLDEPLTGLDPTLRVDVRDGLLAVQKEYGPALLLVTHDLDEAAAVGDRIGVLLGLRLAQVAPAAELLTFPESLAVARFLGGFAEIAGEVSSGVFHSALGSFGCRNPLRDGPGVGVVRSDAVALAGGSIVGRVVAVRTLAARVQVTVLLGDEVIGLSVAAAGAPHAGDEVRPAIAPDLLSVFARA